MDPLMQFLTWQFMLFSLVVAGGTFVLRLVVEYFFTTKKSLGLWENLVLPIFPLGLGAVLGAVISVYPYPATLVGIGSRMMFGVVAGMFSGVAYRVVNAMLNAKVQSAVNANTASDPSVQVNPSVQQIQVNVNPDPLPPPPPAV